MDNLLNKIKADKLKVVKIDDISFTLKKIDAFVLKELQTRSRKENIDFETEALLNSIVDYKGIKVSHLTDNKEAYTEEEWNKDLEFNREYLQIYLGENPECLAKLYGEVVQSIVNFNSEVLKKKANYNTESKE